MKNSRCVIFVVAACLLPSLMFAQGDAAKGKNLYVSKCQSCHGADGNPPPAMVKAYPTLKPLSDETIQGKADAEWKNAIVNGVGKMKAIPDLKAADLNNVVAAARACCKSHSNTNNNKPAKP